MKQDPSASPFHPIMDIHTHVVPSRFPASLAGEISPIEIRAHCDCGRADVFIDGSHFRKITNECWDTDRRIEAMDQMGIEKQVLSPMPELLSFWRPVKEATAIAEHVNTAIATMVERAPDRFAAFGMVPLQDCAHAIQMLEEIMAIPGFHGVEIGTNINGLSLGDGQFNAFFAAAERLGAAIFVHPVKPAARYPASGPLAMDALALFPVETAIAAVSLIANNLLIDYPKLRIAFSHGGGALALLLSRLDHGWSTVSTVRAAIKETPSQQARRFFYDTLVYDKGTLRFLVQKFGITQLCIGTDLPFAVADRTPLNRIEALGISPKESNLLLRENAARFLGYGY